MAASVSLEVSPLHAGPTVELDPFNMASSRGLGWVGRTLLLVDSGVIAQGSELPTALAVLVLAHLLVVVPAIGLCIR